MRPSFAFNCRIAAEPRREQNCYIRLARATQWGPGPAKCRNQFPRARTDQRRLAQFESKCANCNCNRNKTLGPVGRRKQTRFIIIIAATFRPALSFERQEALISSGGQESQSAREQIQAPLTDWAAQNSSAWLWSLSDGSGRKLFILIESGAKSAGQSERARERGGRPVCSIDSIE